MNKRMTTTTKTGTGYNTTVKKELNKTWRNLRYHTTSKYMTKRELVMDLMSYSGCAERTAYHFINNLENSNKIKTVNLYKIK